MKGKLSHLILYCLILITLSLTACASENRDETPAPDGIDYAELGMSGDEVMMWEERGIANLASAGAASALAEFAVVTPSYIPESLHLMSQYMVSDHNAGLRSAGMEPKFDWVDVTLLYSEGEEGGPTVTFIQSNHDFNSDTGESAGLCGRTVLKQITAAEGEDEIGSIAYGWENGGIWYYLTGKLTGAIDEVTLEEILCSINTD